MCKVTSMRKIKPQDLVARLQTGKHDGSIGLCPRVRLHVRPFRSEKFFRTVNGKLFNFVNHLTTTVVALSRQALSVLVREDRSHSFHYLGRGKIFGGY